QEKGTVCPKAPLQLLARKARDAFRIGKPHVCSIVVATQGEKVEPHEHVGGRAPPMRHSDGNGTWNNHGSVDLPNALAQLRASQIRVRAERAQFNRSPVSCSVR